MEAEQVEKIKQTRASHVRNIEIPAVERHTLPPLPEKSKRTDHYIVKQDLPRDKWETVVEYELDDEDDQWLAEHREQGGDNNPITEQQLAATIDRLEKAHYSTVELAPPETPKSTGKLETETATTGGSLIQKEIELSPDAFKAIVAHWKQKRAKNFERHHKQAQDMTNTMQGRSRLADWNNPKLFPLRALRETCGLLVSWNSGFVYTVCDHLFLIPRLQNEYKLCRNIKTCNFGRPRRAIRSRSMGDKESATAAVELLQGVRKEMEQARILLHCVISRERFKLTDMQLLQQIFTQRLTLVKRKEASGDSSEPSPKRSKGNSTATTTTTSTSSSSSTTHSAEAQGKEEDSEEEGGA
eukprot:TRINITY_DN67006_c14_g2_i1.p1 TRINITY_DN67006_c14_g2~~TRINITY_DN67006_c14_g2_i1.p1  ORF type:complete len:414 (+),score=41.16 TRINITY_DN67006_c14_g2_i1:178-1242(+)